jgi:hypothetical protein
MSDDLSKDISEKETTSTIRLSSEMMRLLGNRLLLGDLAREKENSSDSKVIDDFAVRLLKHADKLDTDKLALKRYGEYLKRED